MLAPDFVLLTTLTVADAAAAVHAPRNATTRAAASTRTAARSEREGRGVAVCDIVIPSLLTLQVRAGRTPRSRTLSRFPRRLGAPRRAEPPPLGCGRGSVLWRARRLAEGAYRVARGGGRRSARERHRSGPVGAPAPRPHGRARAHDHVHRNGGAGR